MPVGMETIVRAAAVATPFLFYWLGRGTVKGGWRVLLWVVAVSVALTAIAVPAYKDWERAELRTQLVDKIYKAETLAKAIPKGCPKGLDHRPWATKVEDWRTETDRILAKRLPGFAADRGDYPHRPGCLIEWVRNRLDYFMDQAKAISLALGKP